MKFLTRFGCGCIGIDFGNNEQLIVESCYSDSDMEGLYLLHPSNRILESNLPGTPDPVATERIFKEINRLMTMGRKFETLQRTLGIKEKE